MYIVNLVDGFPWMEEVESSNLSTLTKSYASETSASRTPGIMIINIVAVELTIDMDQRLIFVFECKK